MNCTKLSNFFFVFICFFASLKAQVSLPKFSHITIVSYDLNTLRTKQKDSVELKTYASINSTGFIEMEQSTHKGIMYYSYQLSPGAIDTLNQFFNGKKKLKNYVEITSEKKKYHIQAIITT